MKANLPYDNATNEFKDKEGTISLYFDGCKHKDPIGVADFNLADYANHGQKRLGVKLVMKDCEYDDHAFFEVDVHIMAIDKSSRSRSESGNRSKKSNRLHPHSGNTL